MLPGLEWMRIPANCTGRAGVTVFFVLSGFIMCYSYGDRDWTGRFGGNAREFYWSRFARIYPLHWLMFLFALPLGLNSLTAVSERMGKGLNSRPISSKRWMVLSILARISGAAAWSLSRMIDACAPESPLCSSRFRHFPTFFLRRLFLFRPICLVCFQSTSIRFSFALSGLEFILFVDPGRRSFHFACPGLSSIGLTALLNQRTSSFNSGSNSWRFFAFLCGGETNRLICHS